MLSQLRPALPTTVGLVMVVLVVEVLPSFESS
jgi:hypothetical protein